MSVPLPVWRGVERKTVHRPESPIAARYLTRADGTVALAINDAVLCLAGGAAFVEQWHRLTLVRGRRFDVLTMDRVRVAAPYLAGQQHAPLVG